MATSQNQPPEPNEPLDTLAATATRAPTQPATLNIQEEEALHLSAALVLRAAVYLAANGAAGTGDRWAALRTWLKLDAGKHTIEVRASKSNTTRHQALVRWLLAAKDALRPPDAAQVEDGAAAKGSAKKPPPSWVTVSEKKFRSHFDKTRGVIKSWGAGDARAWHVSPGLVQFLMTTADADKHSALDRALERAEPERVGSVGLVQLRWPPGTVAIPSTEQAQAPPTEQVGALSLHPPEPGPSKSASSSSSSAAAAAVAAAAAADLGPLRQQALDAVDRLRGALVRDSGHRTEAELQRILARVEQLTRLAGRPPPKSPAKRKAHVHGPNCGHLAVKLDSKHVSFHSSAPGGAQVGTYAAPVGAPDVGELCFCTADIADGKPRTQEEHDKKCDCGIAEDHVHAHLRSDHEKDGGLKVPTSQFTLMRTAMAIPVGSQSSAAAAAQPEPTPVACAAAVASPPAAAQPLQPCTGTAHWNRPSHGHGHAYGPVGHGHGVGHAHGHAHKQKAAAQTARGDAKRACCGHDHGHGHGHGHGHAAKRIRANHGSGDHWDYLVENANGQTELHHPYIDAHGEHRCEVHGTVLPAAWPAAPTTEQAEVPWPAEPGAAAAAGADSPGEGMPANWWQQKCQDAL